MSTYEPAPNPFSAADARNRIHVRLPGGKLGMLIYASSSTDRVKAVDLNTNWHWTGRASELERVAS